MTPPHTIPMVSPQYSRLVVWTLIGLAGSLITGCDQSLDRMRRSSEIRRLGLAYHTYHNVTGRAPKDLDDLRPQADQFPNLFSEIEQGQFVLIWDAFLYDDGQTNDRYVLGFEEQVPESGGFVLLGGGACQYLTPEQFAAMPKVSRREAAMSDGSEQESVSTFQDEATSDSC